ncbi:MAG: hypothetical protein WBG30_06160 [Psychrilyobacter sp.]|uniref:hypothetical protein n=1 Tax=Psychrilyobacter sp. TaxID=2586924 RepID=UPI003C709CA0
MNKKLLLLAGILVLGATTFAADAPAMTAERAAKISTITDSSAIEGLVATRQTGDAGFSGSYAGEVKVIMNQGPGRSDKNKDVKGYTGTSPDNYANSANKIEWTVGKGKVSMGKLGFIYDVDRDYNFDKNWNKTNEGWDTEFGLDYQGGTFDMMGKEWTFVPSVAFGYDKTEMYTSNASNPSARDNTTKKLFKFNPKISTTYYGFAMDISPIIAYDRISETTAFQLDISNYRKLGTEGLWSMYGDIYFDFAGTEKNDSYANDVFNGKIDKDNKFAFSIEQYLGYEREITGNVYFTTEFGLEAYSLLQGANNSADMYVKPEMQYRANLGDANITPYVAYKTWTATDGMKDSVSKNELSVGVRFGTKF